MSWPQRQEQSNVLVTAQMLEERINMYISAMDGATAINNGNQSSQLQQDIQTLVDLMEKISAGQVVTEQEVPPPLMISSLTDVLANPLGELSSRLAEYHKALYFAEEELSDDRMNKIQRLQRGLQTIHELQKRAQSGFPVRVDEIPPPVAIPSDDEFDPEALNTLTSRLDTYNVALSTASQSESDRRRIPKLQSAIRTVEFLLTRAKANRPVWKKDIPPEFEYCVVDLARSESPPINKVKVTLRLRVLQKIVQDFAFKEQEQQKRVDQLKKKLLNLETELSGKQAPADVDSRLAILTKEVGNLESMAFAEKTKDINGDKRNLDLIDLRVNEYKAAALASKREGQVSHAIQHFKIVKGLLALKKALENGESVDMTLVPPPPREFTPTSESHPPITEPSQDIISPEAAQNVIGATAQLTPVIIKPAVESAEDKLAKRLFSYLDKGVDVNLSTSKQMLNIHNISVSTAQALPKVQNTEPRKENVPTASIKSDASSNNASEANETDPSVGNIENHREEVRDDSLIEYEEHTSIHITSSHTGGLVAENTYNGVSGDSFPAVDNQPGPKSSENEAHSKHQIQEEITSNMSVPNSFPLKSADIYSRKTLDTVGFLSCQVVPEHSAQPKAAVSSRDSLTLVSNKSRSESEALEQQKSAEANKTSMGETDLLPLDLIQPDSPPTIVNTASSKTNDTRIKTLPMEQPSNTEKLYSPQDARNGYGSFDPSSLTMNIQNSDLYSSNINDHPSLPVTLEPTIFNANISRGKDIGQPSPLIHNPGHNLSISTENTIFTNNSSDNVDLSVSNRERQERDLVSGIDVISSVEDSLTLAAADSKQDRSIGRTSPDTLEFQDLIDSMAMPLVEGPASLDSPIVKPPSQQNKSLEPSLFSLNQSVLSGQNASLSEALENSRSVVSDHRADCPENDDSAIPPFIPSRTQHSVDEENTGNKHNVGNTHNTGNKHKAGITQNAGITHNEGITHNAANTSLSFASQDLCMSNNVSQDNIHNSSSQSPELPDYHTQAPDNDTSALGSNAIAQKPLNILNGNLPALRASSQQNPQWNSVTQTSIPDSQPAVNVSKSKSASTARPSSVFAYSDVAFTCLENLKYDCILSLAKGTEESKQEEKKLRAKFELIKSKLQNGGKRTWEVYKACVQREHASIIQQIEDLCLLQQWSEVQLLSEKKSIAERELTILTERLPELKY